jgi:hypothetical protein
MAHPSRAHTANWDSSAVLSLQHAKIPPRTQEFATSKDVAGRAIVAGGAPAAQSIEQKKLCRATRLRKNVSDGAFFSTTCDGEIAAY